MADSKHRRATTIRRVAWFYGVIVCANILLAGTVLLITAPAPSFAVAPHFIRRLPPRVITQGVPIRVVIPSIAVDLAVQTGGYDPTTETWSIDTSHAFYANMSVPSNDNNGTTLLYAHGRAGLFATLPSLQPGARALVYTANGHLFSYIYRSSVEVDPSMTDIFATDGDPSLLLQTCSGDWSQYRALYSFTLSSVSRS